MGRDKPNRGNPTVMQATPARSGEPPAWAVATVIAIIVTVSFLFWLLDDNPAMRAWVPFANSDYFFVGLIALPMVTLLFVAVLVKAIDVRRAKSWTTTQGRVMRSKVEARRHRFAGGETTVRNEPLVEYEFIVSGQRYRGTRIGIGDDAGGPNTEATLKRYPAGADVTVYYDPADPRNCVLERDVPKEVAKGCLVLLAAAAALAVGAYVLLTAGMDVLERHVPPGRAPITMFITCFGAFVLLFFFAFRSYSKRAMHWPAVPGTVVESSTERLEKVEKGRTHVTYAPAVEYSYRVNGIEYHSRTINLGVTMAGSQSWAERIAAKYPVGRALEVHHDPADPTIAALENPTGASWIILLVALACFALAMFTGGVFG